MNRFVPLISLIILTTTGFAQTTKTRYFTSQWLTKEVPKGKARFSQTIIQHTDSTVIEIKDLIKKMIVIKEAYKGKEPYGIWKNSLVRGASHINYNFSLVYADPKCDSLQIMMTDYFQDNDSIGYKAPKIKSGELSVSQFVSKRIIYPAKAMNEGIQGVVYTKFTLTKEGNVENVVVKRGINILIDKEAVRVIRQLKFSPPTLRGKSIALTCIVSPIKFIIEE